MKIKQHTTPPLKTKCLGKISVKKMLMIDIYLYNQDHQRKEEHQEPETHFQHCNSIKVLRAEALFDISFFLSACFCRSFIYVILSISCWILNVLDI